MRYTKETSRIVVKFYDSDTEKLLFEMKDRNWMNIGEVFSTGVVTSIVTQELKNKTLPKKVMVMVGEEYILEK